MDIARWDIVGQATGRRMHKLLGGAYHDRVRVYASAIMPNTPEDERELVARRVEQGYTAVKLGWGPSAASRNSWTWPWCALPATRPGSGT